MSFNNITNTCKTCGEAWEDIAPWHECEQCEKKRIAHAHADAFSRAKIARRAAFWEQVSPPLYQNTNKTRLKPILSEIIDRYEYGAKGVGFIGTAGAGKTRAAVCILYDLHMSDRSTLFLSATGLSAAAAAMFSSVDTERAQAKETLRRCRKVSALLLDDLGKGRLTDRAESELYDILEHRTAHLLPTLWTSNSDASGLHAMFSPDRADALIRRLGKEFCEHVIL